MHCFLIDAGHVNTRMRNVASIFKQVYCSTDTDYYSFPCNNVLTSYVNMYAYEIPINVVFWLVCFTRTMEHIIKDLNEIIHMLYECVNISNYNTRFLLNCNLLWMLKWFFVYAEMLSIKIVFYYLNNIMGRLL